MLLFTQYKTTGYVAHRYQQCHWLAALPAKMSVYEVMQDSRSVISNKPRLHTKQTHIRIINTQKASVMNKNK